MLLTPVCGPAAEIIEWVNKNGPHVYRPTPGWPTFDPASGYSTPPASLVADTETAADAALMAAAVNYVREALAREEGTR